MYKSFKTYLSYAYQLHCNSFSKILYSTKSARIHKHWRKSTKTSYAISLRPLNFNLARNIHTISVKYVYTCIKIIYTLTHDLHRNISTHIFIRTLLSTCTYARICSLTLMYVYIRALEINKCANIKT